MPDTLITPPGTMARLVEQHQADPADVTLGLFPTTTPHKYGMVELDVEGHVVDFVDKPSQTDLRLMWGLAVWSPRFTCFLSSFLSELPLEHPESVLSDVFLAALKHGLQVQALVLEGARYHDIGRPEDFQAVVRELALGQWPTFE